MDSDLSESVDDLQRVAEYRWARKVLRQAGTASLVFGLMAVLLGAALFKLNAINVVLMALGVLLLVSGLANIVYPTAAGAIIDGIGLILVGVWNLFITFLDVIAGHPPRIHWAIMGAVQIGWGIYRFVSFPRYQAAFQQRPSSQELEELDALVKRVVKTKTKDAENVIAFQTKGFQKLQQWKGQLARDAGLFVNQTGHDVLLARRDDVEFTVKGKVLIGKRLKAQFRIGQHSFSGDIAPESFAKYEAWQAADLEAEECRPAHELEEANEPASRDGFDESGDNTSQ